MNGEVECSVCHAKVAVPAAVSKTYDSHRSTVSSRQRALKVLLVSGDCVLAGLQPILVYMCKVDGKFKFSPVSVNFLTEITKIIFAIVMLFFQSRHLKVGEKPLLTVSTFVQAARNNALLAVPALLYAINNYLKFIMQLYFNPATVKMLGNLKVLVIAVLLKVIMRRCFSTIQWEALALLLIGISVNQLKSQPEGSSALGLPVSAGAYLYTLCYVTVPALASIYNEKALKSQFDTSIYLQDLFLYGYGAIFNFFGLVITVIIQDFASLAAGDRLCSSDSVRAAAAFGDMPLTSGVAALKILWHRADLERCRANLGESLPLLLPNLPRASSLTSSAAAAAMPEVHCFGSILSMSFASARLHQFLSFGPLLWLNFIRHWP